MSHESLAQLIHIYQDAIRTEQEPLVVHENIVSVLRGLEHGDIRRGQAIRLLTYQALLAEESAHAALYRKAAAAIRQMQRKEQEHDGHA